MQAEANIFQIVFFVRDGGGPNIIFSPTHEYRREGPHFLNCESHELFIVLKLIKVWLNEREVMQLNGHSLGVWAGIVLPETGIMVTGSADKTIRLWKTGRCKKVLEQHTQSVRGWNSILSPVDFLIN